jgi:hypothetical protein
VFVSNYPRGNLEGGTFQEYIVESISFLSTPIYKNFNREPSCLPDPFILSVTSIALMKNGYCCKPPLILIFGEGILYMFFCDWHSYIFSNTLNRIEFIYCQQIIFKSSFSKEFQCWLMIKRMLTMKEKQN